MKSQKKLKKYFFSEFENFRTQCQFQKISVSHNVRIKLKLDSDHAKVKQLVKNISYFHKDTLFLI